jgi:hypothetical protein
MLKLASDELRFGDADLEAFWCRFEAWFKSFDPGYRYADRLESYLNNQEAVVEFYREENRRLSNKVFDVLADWEVVSKQLIEVKQELEKSKGRCERVMADREVTLKSHRQLQRAHNRAVTERNNAQRISERCADDNEVLREQMAQIFSSHSWRMTAGFRAIRRLLLTGPRHALRRRVSKGRGGS